MRNVLVAVLIAVVLLSGCRPSLVRSPTTPPPSRADEMTKDEFRTRLGEDEPGMDGHRFLSRPALHDRGLHSSPDDLL